ncbi:2'-5' RNA ligase family protein [Streptomyces sp. MS06]|uniref:2'-5' RNA ligase family protein n=1 Tax=Streptomyces sp. MS06 TaxID=3385974 RepID=UPI0039A0694C
MGTVTIGVSIAVPEPHGSLLQQLRAGFGDAAALGIPTHVTLLPPTEVEESDLPAIEAHLTEVAATGRSFPMRLRGTGTFRPLSPVVFVQVVEGAEACTWLQKEVRDASGPVARELQFPYHPHVTVAHGIDEAAMDRAFEELSGYDAGWPCTGFGLYEQGADCVWRKLREFPFGSAVVPSQAGSADRGSIPAADAGTRTTGR